MKSTLTVAEIDVDVELKPIKNTHLSVYPPDGRVVISAPLSSNRAVLRAFVIKNLSWIRDRKKQFAVQPREPAHELTDRESHFVWGRRYLIVNVIATRPFVRISGRWLKCGAPEAYSREQRAKAFESWRREELRTRADAMVETWARCFKVDVDRFYIQRMRTKWGSSTPSKRIIRLNLELVRLSPDCLEYVIAHELAHFREPNHGYRFRKLLDDAMPGWEAVRAKMSAFPLTSS